MSQNIGLCSHHTMTLSITRNIKVVASPLSPNYGCSWISTTSATKEAPTSGSGTGIPYRKVIIHHLFFDFLSIFGFVEVPWDWKLTTARVLTVGFGSGPRPPLTAMTVLSLLSSSLGIQQISLILSTKLL